MCRFRRLAIPIDAVDNAPMERLVNAMDCRRYGLVAGRGQPLDELDPAQFEPLSSTALLATGCPARSVRPGPRSGS